MKLLLLLLLIAFFSGSNASSLIGEENGDHNGRELLSSIISFADQIQNAVPTVPTTPMPTESPTYSVAPSPSPSEIPTGSPTISIAPSIAPTIAPTTSHRPTNFPTMSSRPSMMPSVEPTGKPSCAPSVAPTTAPTKSAQPSILPSSRPSKEPSLSPSEPPSSSPTSFPSESPSSVPTVSASPTLMYKLDLQVNTSIPLRGIATIMNTTQIEVFESIARYFIQRNLQVHGGVAVLVSEVRVEAQHVIELQDGSDLIVDLTVQAEYESLVHPDHFDFQRQIQKTFGSNFSLFKSNLLDSGDLFFEPLDPTKTTNNGEHKDSSGDAMYGYLTIIICSIAASFCACIAAYYAIRISRAENQKGDKLGSGTELQAYANDPVGSNLTEEDVGDGIRNAKSIEIIKVSNSPEKEVQERDESSTGKGAVTPQKETRKLHVETIDGVGTGTASREGAFTEHLPNAPSQTSSKQIPQVMSPNSMEAGTRLGALAESILRSESFGSNRDPPTDSNRYMYAPKPIKGDPSAKYSTATFGVPRPEQRDDFNSRINANNGPFSSLPASSNKPLSSSIPMRRDPSVVGAPNFSSADLNSFFKKDPEQRGSGHIRNNAGAPQQVQRNVSGESPRSDAINNKEPTSSELGGRFNRGLDWPSCEPVQDVQLTVGRNGRLRASTNTRFEGRKARNETLPQPSPTSSAVSSSINAFLNMVGGTLGAAPLASPLPKKEEKKEEKNDNFIDVLQREGLYDVFAPPGALGIVVDTTKEGPAVHSLKQTSPMLGLINPGDLIVGLDEQDTRSMTAATLTRLMASKSNQKERKITLLAADY